MQFDAELLLIAMAPVFLACIGWEARHMARTRADAQIYNWRDTFCNAALALMHQGADKLAWLAVVPVYAYIYTHYRVLSWQPGWLAFVALFAPPGWAAAFRAAHAGGFDDACAPPFAAPRER